MQLRLFDEPEVGTEAEVVCDDCLAHMEKMEGGSVDAIITDPPYGLEFMGMGWDGQVPGPPYWKEALRVAKPGAHLLCFGGTRTFHRMACAIEDAGWEIRDTIMWVYGSGFPKSMDVSKAIDRMRGATRKVVGTTRAGDKRGGNYHGASDRGVTIDIPVTEAATDEARRWDGWGTSLKPAWEPIIVARKPLDGTVAHTVLKYGTGAINIDACRVGSEVRVNRAAGNKGGGNALNLSKQGMPQDAMPRVEVGRFPANLVHDGSDEVVALFPDTGKSSGGGGVKVRGKNIYGRYGEFYYEGNVGFGDSGSAARFFYCAKASKRERGEGNGHPTVKPVALMEWLVRLVTADGATVLDPFAGSGTTMVACRRLGRRCIGIERDPGYCEIIERRLGPSGEGTTRCV